MFMYATPTFITKVLCLVTLVQLLLLTLSGLVSMMPINAKAMPINDNNYNCHITTIEFV